jgi:hypothetical protein
LIHGYNMMSFFIVVQNIRFLLDMDLALPYNIRLTSYLNMVYNNGLCGHMRSHS